MGIVYPFLTTIPPGDGRVSQRNLLLTLPTADRHERRSAREVASHNGSWHTLAEVVRAAVLRKPTAPLLYAGPEDQCKRKMHWPKHPPEA